MHYPIDFAARNRNNFGVALCGKVKWFGWDWDEFLHFWHGGSKCVECARMVKA